MKRVNVWAGVTGWTAVLALALGGTAGCAGSAGPDTPAGATSGPTVAATTPAGTSAGTPAATDTPSMETTTAKAAPALPDGRSPVYLTGLNTADSTVTFDLIEFLTGDAAQKRWKKEHPENPDGPDNDYMIINDNPKLRILPVAAGAECVVLATLGGLETKTISYSAMPAFLKKHNQGLTVTAPHISVLPFWLTVKNGSVTKFEEQFLP